MEATYLLTFMVGDMSGYLWFNTEEELRQYIKDTKDIVVFEAFKIDNVEILEI